MAPDSEVKATNPENLLLRITQKAEIQMTQISSS